MVTREFLTMDDGCRIACDYTRKAEATTIVLSASLGTSLELFDAQMEALSDKFSVLRYDLRGHGHSDAPLGAYSFDRLGRDVLSILDAFDLERVHFLGVSIGGMTGQWLGCRAPDRLHSLVLANTAPYMGPPQGWADRIAAVQSGGMEPMVDPVIERWFTPDFQAESSDSVAKVAGILKTTDPNGYAGCCAAIRDMDMRPILGLIDCPTLVIGGARDPATPPCNSHELSAAIAGAKLRMLDAAHLSNLEQSAAFNSTVLEFLEGV